MKTQMEYKIQTYYKTTLGSNWWTLWAWGRNAKKLVVNSKCQVVYEPYKNMPPEPRFW